MHGITELWESDLHADATSARQSGGEDWGTPDVVLVVEQVFHRDEYLDLPIQTAAGIDVEYRRPPQHEGIQIVLELRSGDAKLCRPIPAVVRVPCADADVVCRNLRHVVVAKARVPFEH